MVKGVSKRVVVVREPGNGMFEQAIFIIKNEENLKNYSAEEMIKEACITAELYTERTSGRGRDFMEKVPAPIFALLGAAVTAIIWGVTVLLM